MSAASHQAHYLVRAVAAVALVLSLPVILVTAATSLAHYRQWPFFVHDRVGLGGRTFRLLKIRTLPPATNPYVDKYELRQTAVPRAMALVRRLHLDELPQLVHVVRGQMAFVGPRPEMRVLHERLPRRFAETRTAVLPGLTCLWQISPHCAGLIGERPEYDRLDGEHRGTRLDLWIVGRTVVKMLTGRTAHLHEIPQWAVASTGSTAPGEAAALSEPLRPQPTQTTVSSPHVGLVD